jgi:protein SCO1
MAKRSFQSIILLLLLFIVPIGISLFIKFFGQHKFDIPLLYQEMGVMERPGCDTYSLPYSVNMNGWKQSSPSKAWVVTLFPEGCGDDCKELANQWNRIRGGFSHEQVQMAGIGHPFAPESWVELDYPDSLLRCMLLLDTPLSAVLLDAQGRIRGHYLMEDREEADRLIAELKILLTQ